MRETSSRMLFVGVCAWISLCLLFAGWFPDVQGQLSAVWQLSGLTGLVSAVGLAEVIKADIRKQEQLLHEYMQAAMTDGLTGLANRQAFDKALRSAFSEFSSGHPPLSIVILDIDHFKTFNDRWGHQAGDEILQAVARTAIDFFHHRGCVARYGGEEFAVVLPGTDLAEAFRLADRFRGRIKDLSCAYRTTSLHITVSLGVAELQTSENPEELIRRADTALYTAKRMGRDCAWFSSPDTPPDLPAEIQPPATAEAPQLANC